MSAWIVYSKDGTTERCRLKKLEYSGSFMNERTVTATFECESEVAFDVFDYIEYRGEKFELEAIPSVKKTSSRNYEYELRFVSLKYELERCEMRDIVPNDNGIVYPTPLTFSFTGDVTYLAERIQANLDALYGKGVWSIVVAEGVTSEDKNITISQQNCWNALSLVNTTYELDFTVKGRVVTIGGNKPSISHVFQYGKGKGLYEIERSADTETGIVTKLRAYGGTKNLDYSYPKKPEWSDSILDTSFVLSPLRLMLPSFKTDGKTDYIMADESLVAKYGIREASVIYEDIYPSITGATNSKGEAIDEIKAVDDIDDSKSTFVIHLHELGFDLEDNLTTANAQVSMKTGAMQGYTFNIADNGIERLDDGSYKLTLGRITASSSDTDNFDIPNSKWNMKAGDKFVFLNILMPQEYIRSAENRLLERAKEYLAEYGKTNFSYNVGLHDKFLKQNQSVYNELIEGSKLSVYDEELGISENVTIQSISITENMEDNILPQVKVTLNNKPSASTLDRIQGQIKELSETASNSFSSQSELLQQYRKKLDKPFFDRLFVAIGTDGKELASTDTVSPIAYIKAKYSFVTVGGVTMYAKDENINVPTIVDSLPFDNTTIWYNPTTKQIEVIGGAGGGVADSVSWANVVGKPTWLLDDKISYSEIDGTPDLSVYAKKADIPSLSGYATESWVIGKGYALNSDLTALSNKVTDFLEGSDTDNIINKWKELEAFLTGLDGSNDLATILSWKADKTYVDETFVTIGGNTEQIITGAKDFTGGLKVNGSTITYDKTNKYWKLEGDLLVTGGVTMYGNDSEFVSSTIMDAILYDDSTLGINANGQLYVKGGTGGGVSGDYLPLIGGTISGTSAYPLVVNTTDVQSGIQFLSNNDLLGVIINGGDYGTALINFKGKYRALGVDNDGNAYTTIDYSNTKANLLHTYNYSSYALPLSGGTLSGDLLFDNSNHNRIIMSRGGNYAAIGNNYNKLLLEFKYATYSTYHGMMIDEYGLNYTLRTDNSTIEKYKVWNEYNDGSGSGLNADLLDGVHLMGKEGLSGIIMSWSRASFSTINQYFGNGNIVVFDPLPTDASSSDLGANTVVVSYGDNSARNHQLAYSIYENYNPKYRRNIDGTWSKWKTFAFTSDNVASATKLQTARTIWGQNFDGTGNVDGRIRVLQDVASNFSEDIISSLLVYSQSPYGLVTRAYNNGNVSLQVQRESNKNETFSLILNPNGGNVGIGTVNPTEKLDINGNCRANHFAIKGATIVDLNFPSIAMNYGNFISFGGYRAIRGEEAGLVLVAPSPNGGSIIFRPMGNTATSTQTSIDTSGNMLVSGGVTMYSDQRKKTILNHVELSLQQVANAPLIEHYYNSDTNKTTHVGSIAQYWAEMNDWFCKLDNEGFYTMEIQNAALASAISVARELVKFETETDKRIRLLEEENKRLKEEVEQLKWNIA